MRKLQIGVIGSAGPEEYPNKKPLATMFTAAEQVGSRLAEQGCIVVNGGKGGVMEAVSRGAKMSGGITVAEVSGANRMTTNRFIDIEVVTGDVAFRGPSQLIGMCDAIIALGGGAGTLQELAVAYRMAKPTVLLIGYGGWTDKIAKLDYLDERQLIRFETEAVVDDAVKKVLELVQLELV